MIEIDWSRDLGRVLLVGAAVAVYAASKAAVDALARRAVTGVRFGIGQWIPIAAVVIAATLMKEPEIAVGVIFATSFASLSLVIGFTIFVSPIDPDAPANRVGWAFVLPTALLAFLAGLKGHLSLAHAGILFLEGLAILPLWLARRDDSAGLPVAEVAEPSERRRNLHLFQLILAIVVAGLAGWAATQGAAHLSQSTRLFTTGLLAVGVLGPMLVLPAIGNGMFLANRGQS